MNNLKLLRNEHHESQNALANEVEISQSAVQQYEKGTRAVKIIDTLHKFADHYHVSIDFILGRTVIREDLTDKDKQLAYKIHRLNTPEMRDAALKMIEEMDRLLAEKQEKISKK